MSTPKHTPEPWVAGWGGGITGPNAATMLKWDYKFPIHRVRDLRVAIREPVLALPTTDPAHEANAARIVACVNACAGMDDPAHGIRETVALSERMTHRAVRAEQQRDSLAAALREISDDYRFTHESDQPHPYWGDRAKAYAETARAALAKLDGKP